MALTKRYDAKDKIPAGLENLYVEHEGAWVLHPEVAKDREDLTGKVSEFRTNNTELQKRLDDLKKILDETTGKLGQFDGIDVAKIRDQQKQAELAEELGLKEKKDFEALQKRWVEPVRTELQKKLTEEATKRQGLETEIQKLNQRLSEVLIENEVVRIANEKGARSEAVQDILARATVPHKDRITFRLVDGKPVAFRGNDQAINSATSQPYTISEWTDELLKQAPHLFQDSRGSGASSGGSGGAGTKTGTNPWRKGPEWNLTEQGRISLSDPSRAEILKAQAAQG